MVLRTLWLMGFTAMLVSCAGGTRSASTSGDGRTVDYECDGGEALSVRFLPAESTAVLIRDGGETRLQQQPTGSGFHYQHGPTEIRGKGDELVVTIGRRVPLRCTAVR
jgi:membrane-bound inhibitor of C-type lysozyme